MVVFGAVNFPFGGGFLGGAEGGLPDEVGDFGVFAVFEQLLRFVEERFVPGRFLGYG